MLPAKWWYCTAVAVNINVAHTRDPVSYPLTGNAATFPGYLYIYYV